MAGPSIALIEDLLEAARKDGEHTGLLVCMNAVDLFVERAESLEDFKTKWGYAKALYEEYQS